VGDPFDLELARERREELLREAEERRTARSLRVSRRSGVSEPVGIEVHCGLAREESAVAELLELNGMPRWIAFEERFFVAEEDGKVLGALRYRTESKRLILGLLVVDPWAGEERLARALYRGAGELAREMGVGEVVASATRSRYPGGAGYHRWGRGWRLDFGSSPDQSGQIRGSWWHRMSILLAELVSSFYRPFQRTR
jgi:Acetyltransferase (GNAT) family